MSIVVQDNPIRSFEAQLFEHNRPMLLKDFLRDVDGGCRSRSRSTVKKKAHIVLLRSWSKRAAAKKMSAVHKVIKLLQFASPSSSSKSTSSSSVSLTKRSTDHHEGNNDIFIGDTALEVTKVKVKDILRWRSFRDIVDDDPTPLDYLPTDQINAATFKNIPKPKEDWSSFEEEYEQQSPVSVLDSPFRQVQEYSASPYHPTLATVQREKRINNLTRRSEELNLDREIGVCNATEEKAKQLLRHLKAEDDDESEEEDDIDSVILMDFFIDEINSSKLNDDCKNILRIAKSWKDGEMEESFEDEMKREELFVKDICWNNNDDDFKQEQRELCHQLELTFFNDLIDHLVADFLAT